MSCYQRLTCNCHLGVPGVEKEENEMMKGKSTSITFTNFAASLLLIALFAVSAIAIEKWRESDYKNGWQIWIEAKDFDERTGDTLMTLQ